MTKNRTLTAALTALALLGGASISMAQPANDQGGAPAQQNGGDRRAEYRERMNQQMKENLGATDDEWKVLQPKIEKVMRLRMQAAGGFGMMGMGGGGRGGRRGGGNGGGGGGDNNATAGGGGANQQPQSESGKAAQDLRAALNDKTSSVDTIKAKLDALRTARAKAREDLAAAQKDLQSVVSVKQEAFLVMVGALD